MGQAIRHHIRDDGIYEFPDSSSDVHVSLSPQEFYYEYNKDIPSLGYFIPSGFYETEERYNERAKQIWGLTKDWSYTEVRNLVSNFWIPRTSYRSYEKFVSNQIIPRMTYLNPTKTTGDDNKREFIIGWLIDVGWDPTQTYRCVPPEEPYDDIKHVVDGVWRMFNHSVYPEIKNEYMKLFRINSHRIVQFIDMIDKSIPESPSENIESFIVSREKKMIAHLAWLVKTDAEVYKLFKDRIFKQIDHNIAMSMYINDPLMTSKQRLKRDLMIIPSTGEKNVDPYRDEGHNRIRESIMEEYIDPCDQNEAKFNTFNYYLKENKYMVNDILLRWSNYANNDAAMDKLVDEANECLPTDILEIIEDMYGNFEYSMQCTVLDMAMVCFEKSATRARWTTGDAIRHTLELLRDIYPDVLIAQGKIDPNGYEEVTNMDQVNLIGAIRTIMDDEAALRRFEQISRAFGSQDPKQNPAIMKNLTELALDTMNQTKFQSRYNKRGQDILMRNQQSRNPSSHVDDFMDRYRNGSPFARKNYDTVTNTGSDLGNILANLIPFEAERRIAHNIDRQQTDRRRYLGRRHNVSGLGAASERFLGELDVRRVNYTGGKGRNLVSERNVLDQLFNSNQRRDRILSKYDIPAVAYDEAGISLENVSIEEISAMINECFTPDGKDYMMNLLAKFDDEAVTDYDETQEAEYIQDKIELIKANVEEILNTADPDYLRGGKGQRGSFEPDDVSMTVERMLNRIEMMDDNQLLAFIRNELSTSDQAMLEDYARQGYKIEDIRRALLMYVEANFDELFGDEQSGDALIDQFADYLEDSITRMNGDDIYELSEKFLTDEDAATVRNALKSGTDFHKLKAGIIQLILEDYDLEHFAKLMLGNDAEPRFQYDPNTLDGAMKAELFGNRYEDPGDDYSWLFDMNKTEVLRWMRGHVKNVNMAEMRSIVMPLDARGFEQLKYEMAEQIDSGNQSFINLDYDNRDDSRVSFSNFGSMGGDIQAMRGLRIDSDRYKRRRREEEESDEEVEAFTKTLLHQGLAAAVGRNRSFRH